MLFKAQFGGRILIFFVITLLIGPGTAASSRLSQTGTFADPAFQSTWERTDKPAADGTVKRSFYWGPSPLQQQVESYAEGAGGKRLVQYFDKSRMEINNPNSNKSDPFYVTNGLLTVELVTGQMQVGNNSFVGRYPAGIPLASDSDDAQAPTYATFGKLLARSENKSGRVTVAHIDRQGTVTPMDAGNFSKELTSAYYESSTGHNIPSVFWDFLNITGPVYSAGRLSDARLSDPWFYAAGFPISETYQAKVKINGQPGLDVYIQAYQRRVLTFVPSLPREFQVQMGNIGLHYYDWRYKDSGQPIGATPPPFPTTGTGSSLKLTVTGAVKSTLSLSTTDLTALPPQNLSMTFAQPGGGADNHSYQGPLALDVLTAAGAQGNGGRDLPGRYVVASSRDGRKAVFSWGEIDPIFAGHNVLVATKQDGSLFQGNNAPARLVFPTDGTNLRSLYGLQRLEVKTATPNKPTGTSLQLTGAVNKSLSLTASDLAARSPVVLSTMYQAGGITETHSYKGVPLLQLLNEAGVKSSGEGDLMTKYVVASGSDGRQAIVSWGEIDPSLSGVNVIIAYEENGLPLGGGLTKLVVPSDARGGRYIPSLLSLELKDANSP